MKKGILSKLLITAMAITLLAGCTSKNQPSSTTSTPAKDNTATGNKETETASQKTIDWPTKQITIVCPYSPGGSGDTLARLLAPELEAALGVPVIVTNKTGASGAVGLEYVKNAKADGYTLCYLPVDSCILKPMGISDVSCEDFYSLGRAIVNPSALTVRADSKYNTMEDFINDIKTNPGMVTEGNSGVGAFWHICASSFENATGGSMTHVPFDGAASAAAALLGSNVDAIFVAPGEIRSNLDSGELKVLANLGEERSFSAPDVPTAKEQGLDITIQGWGCLGVSKETPDEIVEILKDAFEVAVNKESVKEAILGRGLDYSPESGEVMDEYAKEQLQSFTELIEKIGLAK